MTHELLLADWLDVLESDGAEACLRAITGDEPVRSGPIPLLLEPDVDAWDAVALAETFQAIGREARAAELLLTVAAWHHQMAIAA